MKVVRAASHRWRGGVVLLNLVVGLLVLVWTPPLRAEVTARLGADGALLKHAPLLAYVAPGRYASIKASHPFPFPADFRR